MNKTNYILALAITGCTAAAMLLADNAATAAPLRTESGDQPKTAMGFLINDENIPVCWCSFPLTSATDLTSIKTTPAVSAGAMADGTYYAQTYTPGPIPLAWNTLDVATGELTTLAEATDETPLYVDMTYDYADKKLWGIYHYGGTSTRLCEVDTSNGMPTATIDLAGKWLATLACNYEGELYGICNDGYLYRFDKLTQQLNQVGFTEYDIEYLQSMEFDHTSGILYWAGCTTYSSCLYSIDTTTGEAIYISPLGVNGELTGLYIPFKIAEPEAPGAVTELSVENTLHNSDAVLRLKLPTVTAENLPLTSISSLVLECDHTVIKSWTSQEASLQPGAKLELPLQISEGFHTFRIYAVNGAGNGLPSILKSFIGEDTPAAPAGLTVTVNGNDATISWNQVTSGQQGGYIDESTLVYTVVRQPGNVVVADASRQLSCVDHADAINVFRYEVVASNAKGKSLPAASGPVVVGTYVVPPYVCDFENDDLLLMWNIVDGNNDETSWKRISSVNNGNYIRMSANSKEVDDWLISPSVMLEAGKSYKLVYNDWCLNPSYPGIYDITLGRDNTPEAQTTILKETSVDWYSPAKQYIYLPEVTETGTYNIGFHAHWTAGYNTLYIQNINVVENTAARLTATVTDGLTPLAGAKVEFGSDKTVYTTDSEGKIEIVEIEAGTYPATVTIFGYEPKQIELTFAPLEHKNIQIEMIKVATGSLNGRVLDPNGRGLAGASVYLHGYDEYSAITDRDGNYSFGNVYRKGRYQLDVHALNYESVSVQAGELAETNTVPDITLQEKLISPENVTSVFDREKVTLSWDRPVDHPATFRYDDGTDNFVHNMELSVISEYTVVGVIYDTPAVFTSMSWHVWNTVNDEAPVDVIVFDLDENGQPTNTILYEQNGLVSENWEWHECQFRHPVVAPRGALFTLRGDARLCMDSAEDPAYPHQPEKMVMTHDYRTEPFSCRLNDGFYIFRGNLTLRAEGMPYGAPRQAIASADEGNASPEATFDVFRLAEGDEQTTSNWTKLTSEPTAEPTFTDTGWSGLAKGRYRYAVKAVYSDGYSSYPAFSGMIPRQLVSDVTMTVTTNTPGETAEGAEIILAGNSSSNSYTGNVSEDGHASFTGVWEGSYKLTCKKKGFVTIEKDIEVRGEADFSDDLTLIETVAAPANLLVEETGTPTERLLRWNVVEGLFEDFEGHENWAINSPGDIGWSYIDGDGQNTYASPNYEFPNMREKMAFIIINPSQTDPNMVDGDFMNTHSGERVLVGYTSSNGDIANNDILISPELDMALDFVISFWARCYYSRYPETMRVGYSTTGNAEEDFEWVGEPITVDDEAWKQFIVNIPKEAKYVAINYISKDKYYLALDDIFIGSADKIPGAGLTQTAMKAAGTPVAYEVYLDGVQLTTTTDTEYLLQNLTAGDHTAGVKSRYASGTTEMTTTGFTIAQSGLTAVTGATERVSVTSNQLSVDTKPGSVVTVFSVDGKEVATASATADGKALITLQQGVYIVHTPISNVKIVVK